MALRYGIVGTGFWAETVHADAAARHPDVEFVGVYGRNPERASAIGARFGVRAFATPEQLFDQVEAVGFAVPPGVQVELALQAAAAGKHLLLEKPVSVGYSDADRLAQAITRAGLASVNALTFRFTDAYEAWLDSLRNEGGWECGRVEFALPTLTTDNPFAGSPWRQEKGALWDVGPHALSLLVRVLGNPTRVTALAGLRDQVHAVLQHETGASSTVSLTISAQPSNQPLSVHFHGAKGRASLPSRPAGPNDWCLRAIDLLVRSIGEPGSHSCDARAGAEIVRVLEAIETAAVRGQPRDLSWT